MMFSYHLKELFMNTLTSQVVAATNSILVDFPSNKINRKMISSCIGKLAKDVGSGVDVQVAINAVCAIRAIS